MPDGPIGLPDGSIGWPDGPVRSPDGPMGLPDGSIGLPDRSRVARWINLAARLISGVHLATTLVKPATSDLVRWTIKPH